jgi:hypothetical protein
MENVFMVHADGQGSPTYKHPDEATATKEAERLAEKLGVQTTVLKAVKVIPPKDITKRVKSYADACKVLGIDPVNEEALTRAGFTKDEIAYRKLKTIAAALNEGWEPDWSNGSQYKYWPWFVYDLNTAGFACANTAYAASDAATNFGSRLCYKTAALARYAGDTFGEIYNDFLLLNR